MRPATSAPTEPNLSHIATALLQYPPRDPQLRLRRAEEVCEGRFQFLHHTMSLPQIDWTHWYVNHLWTYNLYYFEYGLDLAWAYHFSGDVQFASRFTQLTSSWIEGTTYGPGDGWDLYPLSMGVTAWIQALAIVGEGLPVESRHRVADSLYQQLRYLEVNARPFQTRGFGPDAASPDARPVVADDAAPQVSGATVRDPWSGEDAC